jgi:group I intron endonuclease
VENKKLVIEREQFWIDKIDPEFNIFRSTGSSLGYKHTEGTKEKMRNSAQGENNLMFGRTGKNSPRFGQMHTAEVKALISKIHKGKTISTKTKALISLGKNKKVFVYTHSEELYYKGLIMHKFFNSCSDAAKFFDCSTRNISYYLDKNKLYKKTIYFIIILNNEEE